MSRPTPRAARTLLLALALSFVALVPSARADYTGIEKMVTQTVYNEIGNVESPNGSNLIPGKPYGSLGLAWCAHFVNWGLNTVGVRHDAGGRGPFNQNVARAWGYYGPRGYGYGRWGTAHDAMPGDLLVDSYNGTASTGGHISMVVGLINANTVWTVGGNENNGVRLQRKSLDTSGRWLVSLTEFRVPKVDLMLGTSDTGDVQLRRVPSGYGPLVQVTSVTSGSTVLSGTTLRSSTYKIQARNNATGVTETLAADTNMSTVNYSNIRIVQTSGYARPSAQISFPNLAIDPARSGSYSSTT